MQGNLAQKDASRYEDLANKGTTPTPRQSRSVKTKQESCFPQENQSYHTRYHFIRELVNNKEICLEFCRSNVQVADIFTKALARDTFQYLQSCLGVCEVTEG